MPSSRPMVDSTLMIWAKVPALCNLLWGFLDAAWDWTLWG